jgi:MoaA/NifB/PqqE/SkfB family radical SAM enzyme
MLESRRVYLEQLKRIQWEESRRKDAGEFPKVVLVDTISHCNLKCSMCGHKNMQRSKGIMDMSLFKKIIDEIAETDKSVRVWLVFFGEPFLLKKNTLQNMIGYAKEKGLTDVVLNTNGVLLNSEKATVLVESGLDALYVGIDAATPEIYAQIRVGGNLETVIHNIDTLLEIKKAKASLTPEVYTQMVVMEENEHQVDDFVDFWTQKGVIAKIRPKVSWAGLVKASNLVLTENERWPCYWSMQTMSITHDGKAVLCAVDVDARYTAGDITQKSLYSVWNGELKKIRRLQEQNAYDQLPFPCNTCLDWQSATADYHQPQDQ